MLLVKDCAETMNRLSSQTLRRALPHRF